MTRGNPLPLAPGQHGPFPVDLRPHSRRLIYRLHSQGDYLESIYGSNTTTLRLPRRTPARRTELQGRRPRVPCRARPGSHREGIRTTKLPVHDRTGGRVPSTFRILASPPGENRGYP